MQSSSGSGSGSGSMDKLRDVGASISRLPSILPSILPSSRVCVPSILSLLSPFCLFALPRTSLKLGAVSVFHASFHPTKGNILDWTVPVHTQPVDPTNTLAPVDLTNIEFSALPSGVHTVERDVMCVLRVPVFFPPPDWRPDTSRFLVSKNKTTTRRCRCSGAGRQATRASAGCG
jgi:hypothetical protein